MSIESLNDVLLSEVHDNPDGSPMNLTDGVVHGLLRIATSLKMLGLADAATPLGAMEALSKEVHDGSRRIAEGLHAIAEAIARHE
jgi:hypothetical protein